MEIVRSLSRRAPEHPLRRQRGALVHSWNPLQPISRKKLFQDGSGNRLTPQLFQQGSNSVARGLRESTAPDPVPKAEMQLEPKLVLTAAIVAPPVVRGGPDNRFHRRHEPRLRTEFGVFSQHD